MDNTKLECYKLAIECAREIPGASCTYRVPSGEAGSVFTCTRWCVGINCEYGDDRMSATHVLRNSNYNGSYSWAERKDYLQRSLDSFRFYKNAELDDEDFKDALEGLEEAAFDSEDEMDDLLDLENRDSE